MCKYVRTYVRVYGLCWKGHVKMSRHYIVWMIMCLTFLCALTSWMLTFFGYTHSHKATRAFKTHRNTLIHAFTLVGPLPNKLLQMWHFHPRFDQNVKSAEMWTRTTEKPNQTKPNRSKPNKNPLQTNGRSVGWSVRWLATAMKCEWNKEKRYEIHMHELKCFMQTAKVQNLDAVLMVKQQLPVMYWFWCWLIQMPDADHMQRTLQ